MTFNEYQKLAAVFINQDYNRTDKYLNGALGMAGEAGEAIDLIKKWHFHNKTLDTRELIKELGDVMWYIAEIATALEINLDEVAALNIEKLRVRYPDGFTYEDAAKHLDI